MSRKTPDKNPKDKLIDDFVAKYNPYEKKEINCDLRAYAKSAEKKSATESSVHPDAQK